MPTPRTTRAGRSAVFRQLAKYGLVGASNTLVGYGIYAFCVDALQIQYEVSLAIAYVIGAVNGYVLNRAWTFRAERADHATSGGRYTAVQVGAFLVNLGLLHAAVAWLGIEQNLAQAIVVPVVFAATFVPNRLWSFARQVADPAGASSP